MSTLATFRTLEALRDKLEDAKHRRSIRIADPRISGHIESAQKEIRWALDLATELEADTHATKNKGRKP